MCDRSNRLASVEPTIHSLPGPQGTCRCTTVSYPYSHRRQVSARDIQQQLCELLRGERPELSFAEGEDAFPKMDCFVHTTKCTRTVIT